MVFICGCLRIVGEYAYYKRVKKMMDELGIVSLHRRRRQRYDDEFRKNAVKLSYVTTKPIKEFCADLGIHHSMIYRWLKIFTDSGDKTKVAEQQDQLRKLQLELAELKIENEMLKKAAAYVCNDADAQE